MNLCGCGCGIKVARIYKQGHDAKHKSALIKQALGIDKAKAAEALTTITAKGWLSFLEKAQRPKAERTSAERQETNRASAVAQVVRYQRMKLAASELKKAGRRDQVTLQNVDGILDSLGVLA